MILIIDNYDSFTYNIVQYVGIINRNLLVMKNDKISFNDINTLKPTHILISPGPGKPEKAGIAVELIIKFGNQIPIFGICLGHQAITVAYGGVVKKSNEIVHGKVSTIFHNNSSKIYTGINTKFMATRYHSLIAEKETLPESLIISSYLKDGTIMGIEHQYHPVYGVQFHPESFSTKIGFQMIKNFLNLKK